VADRTRLLLLLGTPASPAVATHAAALAAAAVAARNDVCLLLSAGADAWATDDSLRELEATRRLFRVAAQTPALAAVDGVFCLSAEAEAAARAAGLPTLAISAVTPEAMAGRLADWLDRGH
jgi:hypothetical protein